MSHRETFSTDVTNVGRNSTVYVESLDVFEPPAAQILTLQDITLRDFVHFIITQPLNAEDNTLEIPDNGTVQISTTNAVANALSTDLTGSTPFIIGEIRRLEMSNVNNVANNSDGVFWDLSKGGAVPAGIVAFDDCTAQRFASIGTLDGLNFFSDSIGWIVCRDGITLNNMLIVQMRGHNFIGQTGDHIKFTGTLIEATLDGNVFNPVTGDSAFNIASDIDITNRISIFNSLGSLAGGGDFFDPAGLDQTDPKVICHNNGTLVIDSYWIGSMGFVNNAVNTVIALANTYTDIAGTIVAGADNERFTFLDGVLTYIGLETKKFVIAINLSLRKAAGASSRTIRAALFIDEGSGFVEGVSAPLDMNNRIRGLGFGGTQTLKTGDKVKAQIKNETNSEDILIVAYDFVIS